MVTKRHSLEKYKIVCHTKDLLRCRKKFYVTMRNNTDRVWTTSTVRVIISINRNKMMDDEYWQNFEKLGKLDQNVISAQRRDCVLQIHDFIGKHGDKDDSEIIDAHEVISLLRVYDDFWRLWESKM